MFSLLESYLLLLATKKLNSIFDTESKIIQFMGSNKYMITKIKCWPVFKQDPTKHYSHYSLIAFLQNIICLPCLYLTGSLIRINALKTLSLNQCDQVW